MKNSNSNKKGVMVPTIKTFLILFITTIIIISFILILNEYSKLSIDERKINQQLVINKFFNGKCFSNEFGVIEESAFNQESIDVCFEGISQDATSDISTKSKYFV